MKAIILVAGRGSRLGALTDNKPKTLTELAGKPLLEWQMQALTDANVNKISLVTGYHADSFSSYGLECHYNSRWNQTNMVRSLLCASAELERESHLISYGDIAYRSEAVKALMSADADIAITYDTRWYDLWSLRFDDPFSDAESFMHKDGELQSIGAKTHTLEETQGQYMGLLKFSPCGWKSVLDTVMQLDETSVDKLDMTSLLNALLQSGVTIAAVPISGGWVEVDAPSDIDLYTRLLEQSDWSHDWRA